MAETLMEKIIDKTSAGRNRKGGAFKGYSETYAESADFKAAGKSRSKPNLTLSGDMLGLVGVIGETANTVTLGWDENNSNEAAKAHGHITGANKLPVRDFFGLNQKDIDQVRNEFKEQITDIRDARGSARDQAIIAFIRKLEDG